MIIEIIWHILVPDASDHVLPKALVSFCLLPQALAFKLCDEKDPQIK